MTDVEKVRSVDNALKKLCGHLPDGGPSRDGRVVHDLLYNSHPDTRLKLFDLIAEHDTTAS